MRGIEGAFELRFFGPTFHYVPYHDKQPHQYKQEVIRRQKLFEQQKWDQLQRRIDYEQDRRNQKKQRKYNRDNAHNLGPSAAPNNTRNEDDEKRIIDFDPPMLSNGNTSNHNQPQSTPTTINGSDTNAPDQDIYGLKQNMIQTNEKEVELYLNELTQNINKYKYDDNDTVDDIKYRIKRCIKLAKQNKFKKADNALNPTKIAVVNKPELMRSLLSKYPMESPLIINDNIDIQPQYRLDRQSIVHIMQNLNKQSCGD